MTVMDSEHSNAVARCALEMPQYTHIGASKEQMQQYAECVRILYPESDKGSFGYHALGVGIIIFLLFGISVQQRLYCRDHQSLQDSILISVMVTSLGILILAIIASVVSLLTA